MKKTLLATAILMLAAPALQAQPRTFRADHRAAATPMTSKLRARRAPLASPWRWPSKAAVEANRVVPGQHLQVPPP